MAFLNPFLETAILLEAWSGIANVKLYTVNSSNSSHQRQGNEDTLGGKGGIYRGSTQVTCGEASIWLDIWDSRVCKWGDSREHFWLDRWPSANQKAKHTLPSDYKCAQS